MHGNEHIRRCCLPRHHLVPCRPPLCARHCLAFHQRPPRFQRSERKPRGRTLIPSVRMAPSHPHGQKPSAWPKAVRMAPSVRMAKSCYPPSEIGARFATAEALASQRSYFVEIPSNSVAAPNFPPKTKRHPSGCLFFFYLCPLSHILPPLLYAVIIDSASKLPIRR